MHKKRSFIFFAIVSIVTASILSSVLFISSNVSADARSTVLRKALFNALNTCITNPNGMYMKSPITDEQTFFIENVANDTPAAFTMPTYANNDAALKISCREVFLGTNKFGKDFPVTGLLPSSSNRFVKPENLGYFGTGASTDKQCISVSYTRKPTGDAHGSSVTSNKLCVPVKNNVISIANLSEISVNESDIIEDNPGYLSLGFNGKSLTYYISNSFIQWDTIARLDGQSVDAVIKDINTALDEELCTRSGEVCLFNFQAAMSPSSESVSKSYALDGNKSANAALKYLDPSASGYGDFAITDNDYYSLYKEYMGYVADKYSDVYISDKCSTDKDEYAYSWSEDGKNWCEVVGAEKVTERFGGKLSQKALQPLSFQRILSGAKQIDMNNVSDFGAVTPGKPSGGNNSGNNSGNTGDTSDGSDGGGESGLAVCYEGTGVLGWIACPVIELVGNATGYLYENWIEPSLQIQAGQIMKHDQPVYSAWDTFRGFANILFAVAFAIIILAQLTGFGISNYNIKKLLPRLIVVAVLVNISFILCQIAVDLSNILGVALKDMFLGLAGKAGADLGANGFFVTTVKELTLGLAAVGGTAAILGGAVAVATLKYWIFPIIVSLLGCLVAVLFFFILLGVRQAGVVILVILTPLAIVCYALPNTKFFFDRWKKMFASLLVLYPICGAMMGACEYAATILTQIDQGAEMKAGFTLVAMLVDVVPFFFIPSLVKSSMVAMGNLGTKISGLGSRVRSGFERTARGSRFYQEHQGEAQRRLNLKRDETRVDRLGTGGKGKSLIAKARRGLGMNTNLSRAAATRMAIAQSNVDKSTDTGAQVIRARWDSDGTSNDIGDINNLSSDTTSLVSRYVNASRRLFKDPTDHDALEEQKAAASLLASSKPGRNQLRLANNMLGGDIAGMSEDDSRTASRVMQRTANNLLRTNSGDIAKSPILDEQISGMQKNNVDYGKLNSIALTESIRKMNARTMSSLSSDDLKTYTDLMSQPGMLSSEQQTKLAVAAREALSDSRYAGQMDEEAKKSAHRLADGQYTRKPTNNADPSEVASAENGNIRAMSRASGAELDRIQSRIRSGEMDAGERNNLLNTMGQTLVRAATQPDQTKLSANQANQMMQTLSYAGMSLDTLAQQAGLAGATQLQEKLDVVTGMKVPRAPRMSGLRDHPAGWRQATAADVGAMHGQLDGSRLRIGDWVKDVQVSGPPTANGSAPTRITRMSQSEIRAAEMLQNREAEAILNKADQDFADQQQNNPPSP